MRTALVFCLLVLRAPLNVTLVEKGAPLCQKTVPDAERKWFSTVPRFAISQGERSVIARTPSTPQAKLLTSLQFIWQKPVRTCKIQFSSE